MCGMVSRLEVAEHSNGCSWSYRYGKTPAPANHEQLVPEGHNHGKTEQSHYVMRTRTLRLLSLQIFLSYINSKLFVPKYVRFFFVHLNSTLYPPSSELVGKALWDCRGRWHLAGGYDHGGSARRIHPAPGCGCLATPRRQPGGYKNSPTGLYEYSVQLRTKRECNSRKLKLESAESWGTPTYIIPVHTGVHA